MVMAQQILQTEGAESDIVNTAMFLLSDTSRFITGETLRVSGGATLQI